MKRILVPYDTSELSKKALLTAKEFAQDKSDVSLHVIFVADSAQDQFFYDTKQFEENPDQYYVKSKYIFFDRGQNKLFTEEVIAEMDKRFKVHVFNELGVFDNPVEAKVISALDPADEIVKYAEDNDCDLIIMGCRGFGRAHRLGWLGSLSYIVTRTAKMSVMVVR